MENAAEETFRNQDTEKYADLRPTQIGKMERETSGSSRPFFAPRFLPSDPIALR